MSSLAITAIALRARTGALIANPQTMLRLCLALALFAGCIDDPSEEMPESSGAIWGVNIGDTKIEIGSSTYASAADAGPSATEPGMPVRATFTTDDKTVLTLTPSFTGSVMIVGAGVGTAHVIAHYAGETQSFTIEVLPRQQPESI